MNTINTIDDILHLFIPKGAGYDEIIHNLAKSKLEAYCKERERLAEQRGFERAMTYHNEELEKDNE